MEKKEKDYPFYFKVGDVEFVTYKLYNGIECTMSVENARCGY